MYQELTDLLPQIQNINGYTAAAVIERALVSFTGRHPPKELYFTVLEKAGIKLDCKVICNADASALDGATVVALITAVWRADDREELLAKCCDNGRVTGWLTRLKELDQKRIP